MMLVGLKMKGDLEETLKSMMKGMVLVALRTKQEGTLSRVLKRKQEENLLEAEMKKCYFVFSKRY